MGLRFGVRAAASLELPFTAIHRERTLGKGSFGVGWVRIPQLKSWIR